MKINMKCRGVFIFFINMNTYVFKTKLDTNFGVIFPLRHFKKTILQDKYGAKISHYVLDSENKK